MPVLNEWADEDEDEKKQKPNQDYSRKKEIMKSKFPGYSDRSINAGLFIGQDYPYVPGDD